MSFDNKPLQNLITVGRNKGMSIILTTQNMEDFKNRGFDFYANAQYPLIMRQQQQNDQVLKEKLIKITFPDGQVVKPNKLLDATIAVIEYAGSQRVKDLGLKLNGKNLIRDEIDSDEKRPNALKQLSTGHYIYTNCDFNSKLSQIRYINDRLNLGLKIEIASILLKKQAVSLISKKRTLTSNAPTMI